MDTDTPTRQAVHAATVFIYEDTDDDAVPDELWLTAVHVVSENREYDLPGCCATPGAALDAGVKWAADRGLILRTNGTTFQAVKVVDA